MITAVVAVVYLLGLIGCVALFVHLVRTDVRFGTAADLNPRATALLGAICAVAWPAALIAAVLNRAVQPRR